MSMHVETLSIGLPSLLQSAPREVMSGIAKDATVERLAVTSSGFAGDGQVERHVHGGEDKAVYAYPGEHYTHWQQVLGRTLRTAQFGENLTTRGLLESDIVLGARYRVGSAELVATQPRLPCYKLGIYMGDDKFPNRFLASGRLGTYFAVSRPGEIAAGDRIECLASPAEGMTVTALWQLLFVDQGPSERVEWALANLADIDDGWQRRLRKLLK